MHSCNRVPHRSVTTPCLGICLVIRLPTERDFPNAEGASARANQGTCSFRRARQPDECPPLAKAGRLRSQPIQHDSENTQVAESADSQDGRGTCAPTSPRGVHATSLACVCFRSNLQVISTSPTIFATVCAAFCDAHLHNDHIATRSGCRERCADSAEGKAICGIESHPCEAARP